MLFAGCEITFRLLFWAAYLLAFDTGEQGRLRQEVRAFAPERVTRMDDLQNWPQMRCVPSRRRCVSTRPRPMSCARRLRPTWSWAEAVRPGDQCGSVRG